MSLLALRGRGVSEHAQASGHHGGQEHEESSAGHQARHGGRVRHARDQAGEDEEQQWEDGAWDSGLAWLALGLLLFRVFFLCVFLFYLFYICLDL